MSARHDPTRALTGAQIVEALPKLPTDELIIIINAFARIRLAIDENLNSARRSIMSRKKYITLSASDLAELVCAAGQIRAERISRGEENVSPCIFSENDFRLFLTVIGMARNEIDLEEQSLEKSHEDSDRSSSPTIHRADLIPMMRAVMAVRNDDSFRVTVPLDENVSDGKPLRKES